MTTTSVTRTAKKAISFWLLLACVSAAGCTYRFTNRYVSPPPGVHTIAVEAVYDTGKEVLPHEMLWESLQTAFASDGHLRLTSQSQADALVRAHIKEAAVIAVGGNLENDLNPADQTTKPKDPAAFTVGATPPLPSAFRRLTQAGEYRDKGSVNTVIDVEVWNLNTRALLFKKTYPASNQFQAVHAGITTSYNDYLRYNEASAAVFKRTADSLAYEVVSGLMLK